MTDLRKPPDDAATGTAGATSVGTSAGTAGPAPGDGARGGRRSGGSGLLAEILTGSAMLTLLSIVAALGVGALLIIFSDPDVQTALGYVGARPSDTFRFAWEAVSSAYAALFSGSVVDFGEFTVGRALRPLAATITNATPLIAAGLAVALPFRAGLFNIGAEGQILVGATLAAYVGFAFDLPVGVHLLAGIAAGMLGGAVWAGIAGVLKATTGAHEVITTIMLNYIARYLVTFLLTLTAFQRPGRSDPISPIVGENAQLPVLVEGTRMHAGIVLSLVAAAFVWWLLERSTIGFRYRMVGLNPHAARTAGTSVARTYATVMLLAGALAGIAGCAQVLGTERYLTTGSSGGLGFDAITVALLGRSSPKGVVAAGLLFGALKAGSVSMQTRTGTPIDLVLVLQSLIVLFIAAPPLVRAIFRVPIHARPELSGGASTAGVS